MSDLTPAQLRENPVWLERQEAVMRKRIDDDVDAFHMTAAHGVDGLPGTIRKFEYYLPPEMAEEFKKSTTG